jgi:SAM-dependent methyltransferase
MTSFTAVVESLTLRDPAGQLYKIGEQLIRIVQPSGLSNLAIFLEAKSLESFRSNRQIVQTQKISSSYLPPGLTVPSGGKAVSHKVIPFVSYAHEWPPEMLAAAAVLTLDLAEALLDADAVLKDAKPDNILFNGSSPVFIDALSFEPLEKGNPIWRAESQFIRTFLLPLLLYQKTRMPPGELLLNKFDGIEPEAAYEILSWGDRLAPSNLGLVTLPKLLSKATQDGGIYKQKLLDSEEKAKFILRGTFRRLRRQLNRLSVTHAKKSEWSDYTQTNTYSVEGLALKEMFVSEAISKIKPDMALDIGCNTGHFSQILAKFSRDVVSVDLDPVVVGSVWQMAKEINGNILPLVQNLIQPSPGVGWKNNEKISFLSRANKKFDIVVMLAVIHHMMVSGGIPLVEILSLAGSLSRKWLIIEYVAKDDPMFLKICRGREDLYEWFDQSTFEAECLKNFEIIRQTEDEDTTRILYLLKAK